MADEQKQKAEEPKAKENKKEPAQAEAAATGSGEKRTKVNCLTLAEVEAQLKVVKEKMGGFQSRYAEELLLRKKELTSKK